MPKFVATVVNEHGRREITFEARDLAHARAAVANWIIDRPYDRLESVVPARDDAAD